VGETEHEALDRQLILAGRLAGLERLIAGTAHEINNPLTSVAGLASLLLMDADDPQTKEDLEVIAKETERAVVVVRNLRSFVQRGTPESQPCDLNEAVSLVCSARGYELRARGIEPVLDLASGIPMVSAVHEDLLHVVLQLILHAEDALLGAHSANNGAAGGDLRMAGRTLELATLAYGSDAVLTSTHADDFARAGNSVRMEICSAMARRLGGSIQADRLPDGRIRTTMSLPGAA
jgi:signal transduction histidine kinase